MGIGKGRPQQLGLGAAGEQQAGHAALIAQACRAVQSRLSAMRLGQIPHMPAGYLAVTVVPLQQHARCLCLKLAPGIMEHQDLQGS